MMKCEYCSGAEENSFTYALHLSECYFGWLEQISDEELAMLPRAGKKLREIP